VIVRVSVAELDWGRKFLLCAPEYFGVLYEINPWMHTEITVDKELAQEQWQNLVQALRDAGAELEFQPAAEGWPDLVFTANAGIVNGNEFIPTHFKWPERQGETPYDIEWFASRGYDILRFPEGVVHEGVGDALPFGTPENRVLVSGYQTRSDAASHAYLSSLTSTPVVSVKLVDDRLYHLDLTFTPLTERRAMVAAMAFDRQGARSMEALVPEMLVLEDDEALQFACNSVVVGSNIVMPNCPPRVGRQLEAWGFNVVEVSVTEFMKGGGGCRCLSLALDVTLTPERIPA
jgi:N-dimethylarginine dimethylaminohydrolase